MSESYGQSLLLSDAITILKGIHFFLNRGAGGGQMLHNSWTFLRILCKRHSLPDSAVDEQSLKVCKRKCDQY